MRTIRRKIAMTATGLLGAAAVLTTSAVNAHADYTDITFKMYPGKISTIIIYADGKQAGRVNWVADPYEGSPKGDYLCAVDDRSDGYYVKGTLTTGRTVSTNGKPSPGSDCQGGNLPENHGYGLKACLENHYVRACSTDYYVHS
ncbi:hypothetical protein [Streptomyces sp. NPDC058695]|uniref:hypothetical protein n=1 Tax=Streptomyces sp. NPDC058695 TaxID=3346604 RepID=UPI00364EC47C